MKSEIKSIRPFIGAKDFQISRSFYSDLGFQETVLEHNFSVFRKDEIAFYLQDYYAKEWIDNTMIFIEVYDVDSYYQKLSDLNLPNKYPDVKLVPIRDLEWGRECFLHDPSGILWHFGEFK
jgi:catechol 2,3-dioxygenase-like lactoylglutathione lyase family enzyme